jgi:ankyrin repeat protein
MVKWIFEQVPDIWDTPLSSHYRTTALKAAIRSGNVKIVEYLITDHNATLLLPHQRGLALQSKYIAHSDPSPSMSAVLAEIHAINEVEPRVTHTRRSHDDDEVCESLLAHAVQIEGNEEMVEWLCQQGVPTDCLAHQWQRLPITIAIQHGSASYIEILTRYGADLNSGRWIGIEPPIFSAVVPVNRKGSLEFFKLLVEQYGANLHKREAIGEKTVLHVAARAGLIHYVQYLCEKDPSLAQTCDIQGDTPLHFAVDLGHLDCAKILISVAKADPNRLNSLQYSPIGIACRNQLDDIVVYLCQNGADIDKVEDNDTTPLERLGYVSEASWSSRCSVFSLVTSGFLSDY